MSERAGAGDNYTYCSNNEKQELGWGRQGLAEPPWGWSWISAGGF